MPNTIDQDLFQKNPYHPAPKPKLGNERAVI